MIFAPQGSPEECSGRELLAEILETDAEPVAYLIANNPAYTNPTGLGEPLQPRRDIHPIAEDVVFLIHRR
jgi:hypothetical protein